MAGCLSDRATNSVMCRTFFARFSAACRSGSLSKNFLYSLSMRVQEAQPVTTLSYPAND